MFLILPPQSCLFLILSPPSILFLQEIFIKDAEAFIDRPMLDRTDNIPHLINMKGKDWKRARSTLAPTFTAAKMKKMSGIMEGTIEY